MMTEAGLAERCEQATGPDRELDHSIGKTVGWSIQHGIRGNECPRYTASLDAAMTLVPERFVTRRVVFDGQRCRLSLFDKHSTGQSVSAATEPLALCAAALRAHAQGQSA